VIERDLLNVKGRLSGNRSSKALHMRRFMGGGFSRVHRGQPGLRSNQAVAAIGILDLLLVSILHGLHLLRCGLERLRVARVIARARVQSILGYHLGLLPATTSLSGNNAINLGAKEVRQEGSLASVGVAECAEDVAVVLEWAGVGWQLEALWSAGLLRRSGLLGSLRNLRSLRDLAWYRGSEGRWRRSALS